MNKIKTEGEISFDEVQVGDVIQVTQTGNGYWATVECTVNSIENTSYGTNGSFHKVFHSIAMENQIGIVITDEPVIGTETRVVLVRSAPKKAIEMPIATVVTEGPDPEYPDEEYCNMWVKVDNDMWHGYTHAEWHSLATNVQMDKMINKNVKIVYPSER